MCQNARDIAIEPVDLYEILAKVDRLADKAPAVRAKLNAIRKYTNVQTIPPDSLLKMAKFGAVIDAWVKEKELAGTAIQCWTSIQNNYGCAACLSMSLMGEKRMPSACEVDITGAVSMYALELASGTPARLSAAKKAAGKGGGSAREKMRSTANSVPTSVSKSAVGLTLISANSTVAAGNFASSESTDSSTLESD